MPSSGVFHTSGPSDDHDREREFQPIVTLRAVPSEAMLIDSQASRPQNGAFGSKRSGLGYVQLAPHELYVIGG
jgi:hypothetical protein